ncbi:MAG: tyrosine-type recombinase/integrase, partial [Anaerolineaceae bacterium]
FYAYLRDCFGIVLENPAQGKTLRQRVHRWEGARFLDPQGVNALLASIDRSTVKGSRDYALLITYVFTGRRNSEIRNLRWGDIEASGGETWYRWSGKGKSRRDQMPQPVIDAIQDYLRISKRDTHIKPTDFIFVSSVGAQTSAPISANQVRRLLTQHLKTAGFTTHLRVHDLRHTAAMLYKAAGEDIDSIREILDHSNVNTTAIYLHSLEGHATLAWRGVEALLGMREEKSCVHESRIAPQNAKRKFGANLAALRTRSVTIREESLCRSQENGRMWQPLPGTAALSAL